MSLLLGSIIPIFTLTILSSCFCQNSELQLIPISSGCTVQWIKENHNTCEWCDSIFNFLISELGKAYNPSIISNGNSSNVLKNDKGTCRVAFFLSTEFHLITDFLCYLNLKDFDNSLWYFIVQDSQIRVFLDSWKHTIDKNFGYLYPKTVLLVHHEESPNSQFKSR